MLVQIESLPFDYNFAVPMFFYWVLISIITILLIDIEMMNQKTIIVISIITILYGGILFGGSPHAVVPIQYFLIILSGKGLFSALLPVLIIFSFLLASSLIVGRIFCGFACPIGVLQELISKINFKSNLKAKEKAKYRIVVSSKLPSITRRIFLGILIITAIFGGIIFLETINPLTGFSIFRSPFTLTLLISLVSLIVVSIVSIFVYRPWCRFLCPFGAFSSLCSRMSRIKYHRTDDCTECGLCEKICPTQEAGVGSKKNECYFCNRCIEICPSNAIKFSKQ
ncbi:MAG: 4Fe-4S binding protein [Promethearchaeota archaeon]